MRAMLKHTTRLLVLLALLGVAACSRSEEPAAADVTTGSEAEGPASYNVTFSGVTADAANCFYFSGPGDLGRNNQLGNSATYDGSSLRFAGDLVFVLDSSGALVRVANHEYEGTWMSRETITLSPAGGGFVGSYHYDEFEGGSTTPGACHIDAQVQLAP
jgi:hypothetical protein